MPCIVAVVVVVWLSWAEGQKTQIDVQQIRALVAVIGSLRVTPVHHAAAKTHKKHKTNVVKQVFIAGVCSFMHPLDEDGALTWMNSISSIVSGLLRYLAGSR